MKNIALMLMKNYFDANKNYSMHMETIVGHVTPHIGGELYVSYKSLV